MHLDGMLVQILASVENVEYTSTSVVDACVVDQFVIDYFDWKSMTSFKNKNAYIMKIYNIHIFYFVNSLKLFCILF